MFDFRFGTASNDTPDLPQSGRDAFTRVEDLLPVRANTLKNTRLDRLHDAIGNLRGKLFDPTATENILAIDTEVREIATGVSGSSEEQRAVIGEIARNLQEASKGTEAVSQQTESISSGYGDIQERARQLVKAGDHLEYMAGKLKIQIDYMTLLTRICHPPVNAPTMRPSCMIP
ncbi:hypothetical protein [Yunchengibacter salinarum]|uniref:hypothetical protein n=1 Tax=Yunchengibacter salinarum TaxID=3133399 RepID=UPI0035B5BE20